MKPSQPKPAAMPIIRTAHADDAEALAQLAETTFRKTFQAANSAEDMDAHCQTHYPESVLAAEIDNNDSLILVAETENQLAAYAELRWGDAPTCLSPESAGEIRRLYVDHDWHGQGLAKKLMNECLSQLAAKHLDMVWLGVWEHNARAIAFYQKNGFKTVGEQSFLLGADQQRDLIMARPTKHPN